jgi:hypothetical protein
MAAALRVSSLCVGAFNFRSAPLTRFSASTRACAFASVPALSRAGSVLRIGLAPDLAPLLAPDPASSVAGRTQPLGQGLQRFFGEFVER